MNELRVRIGTNDWIHWKTEKAKAWDAWMELKGKMEEIGMNVEDFCPDKLRLRNESGENIDSYMDL